MSAISRGVSLDLDHDQSVGLCNPVHHLKIEGFRVWSSFQGRLSRTGKYGYFLISSQMIGNVKITLPISPALKSTG